MVGTSFLFSKSCISVLSRFQELVGSALNLVTILYRGRCPIIWTSLFFASQDIMVSCELYQTVVFVPESVNRNLFFTAKSEIFLLVSVTEMGDSSTHPIILILNECHRGFLTFKSLFSRRWLLCASLNLVTVLYCMECPIKPPLRFR